MIWWTWRQFRTQAVVAAVVLAALATCLVVFGLHLRQEYDAAVAHCSGPTGCVAQLAQFRDSYRNPLYLLDALVVVAPALVGMFWGAPLVARELETGTHRLVWNQSVTRRRWLAVKLLLAGLAGMTVVGLSSIVLTWAASPYDAVAGDRFSALLFGARNLAPFGYALFTMVLGAVLGLLVRRTVPAMALTFVAVVTVQVLVPTVVRPHLVPPVVAAYPVTAETVRNLTFLGSEADIGGLRIPDAWVVSHSKLLGADGRQVDQGRYDRCLGGGFDGVADCLGGLDLHVEVTYQPGQRYWTFQWRESGLYLAASLLLAALGLWLVRRRVG
ncbi:transmembrane transport protein [Plantactinospora sonchi]|uniref:Transmembrane transport protein n=1 Tax=Plantactinospora sonchi TaxID=1544735 RepID=A0ABU7RZ30_9ACTN